MPPRNSPEGEEIVLTQDGNSGNSNSSSSAIKRWQLSLAGSKAALLKMDDLQGRVGTPGALVRRGTQRPTKAESSVLPALAARRVLVMRECGRGADQGGSGIWLANRKPPYAPKRLRLPLLDGESDDYVMNANLAAGTGRLSSFAKGRGISDCGSSFD